MPSLICLTETWYHWDIPPSVLDDYNCVNAPRETCVGGGVCMYKQKSYSLSVQFINSYTSFEHCIVTMHAITSAYVYYPNLYRPPSLYLTKFYYNLDDFLAAITSKFKTYDIFLVSDLNINLLSAKT